jgi:hypothetical protein
MHPLFGKAIADALLGTRKPFGEKDEAGAISLKYSLAYRIAIPIGALIGLSFLALCILTMRDSINAIIIGSFISGTLTIVILLALYDCYCVKITATPAGIYSRSPFGSREVAWLALETISHNPFLSLFTIRSCNSHVYLTSCRSGLGSLSKLAFANVPESKKGIVCTITSKA